MTFAVQGIGRWMRRHPVWTIFTGMSALVLLLAAIAIWVNFGQGWPVIRVSRETTYITGPLKPNGMPDYVAAINERMREGVTPETNAMVLLQRAVGPRPDNMEIEFSEQTSEAMGVPPLPVAGNYLIPRAKFMESIFSGLDWEEVKRRRDRLSEELDAAYEAPWTADRYPNLREWIARNEEPLELVHEAVQRPDYYRPTLLSKRNESSSGLLIGSPLPIAHECLELARLLLIRATLRLGENRLDDAKADLLAIHRLARHVSRGWTLIEIYFARVIESLAARGDIQLAMHPDLPPELARAYRQELEQLPPLMTTEQLREIIDRGERMMVLDLVVAFQDDLTLAWRSGGHTPVPPFLLDSTPQLTVDLNETLIVVNNAFDQLAEAVGETDKTRQAELKRELDEAARARGKRLRELRINPLPIFLAGPQGRGVILGEYLTAAHIQSRNFLDRDPQINKTLVQRSLLALALGEYRARHGRFPPSLSELVPEYLNEPPIDAFSGEEWIYQVSDDGQSLQTYSVGKNRTDDDGSSEGGLAGPEADDIVIQFGTLPGSREESAGEVGP